MWWQAIVTIESALLQHPSATKQVGMATEIWSNTIFVVLTCGNRKWVVVIAFNRKENTKLQLQYLKPYI